MRLAARVRGAWGLHPDEVHVWSADLDRLAASDSPGELLSADERERSCRFHFERDRRRYVAARGLLRRLVGGYLGCDPSRLRFAYGPQGKPFLASRDALRFNVSHSAGHALLAFAWRLELGVDVEQLRPVPEAEEIARRFFSPREAAELRRFPEHAWQAAFFRCWTRKEAFVKATGDGLRRALDSFDVVGAPGEPVRLRVAEDPGSARFRLEDVPSARGFAAALAVEGSSARVVHRSWGQ